MRAAAPNLDQALNETCFCSMTHSLTQRFSPKKAFGMTFPVTPRYNNCDPEDYEFARLIDRKILREELVQLSLAKIDDEYDTVFYHYPFRLLTECRHRDKKPEFEGRLRSFDDMIGDDTLTHYLTTHAARRFFYRMPIHYSINQDILNIVFPMGIFIDKHPKAPNYSCGYNCRWYHQSCEWHEGLDYPRLKDLRKSLAKTLQQKQSDPCFWHSILIAMINTEADLIGYVDEQYHETQQYLENFRAQAEQLHDEAIPISDDRSIYERIRDMMSSQITTILETVQNAQEVLPAWFKQHFRFLVNLVCNLVNLALSKSWINVLASMTSLANEIWSEFPNLMRSAIDGLIENFKKVIRKFFPHAQSQSSREEDQIVANESFIKTLFGLIGSTLPGFKVDAGILKARLDKINNEARVLTSLTNLWSWTIALLEKLWNWTQIYWFGATSEELAQRQLYLKAPDIQLWINDVKAFEISRDRNGKETAGVTTILTSKQQQDKVIELKERGAKILEKLTAIDSPKVQLIQLVKDYQKKVELWFKMFEDMRGDAAVKHEPFIIYLFGDPAVGKTFAVDYLNQFLCSAAGREYDKDRDVYVKARDSPYFEGYNGQFCLLMDDFLQIKDPQIQATELGFLIDAGSRARLHLNMADVTRKAAAYFNSEVIILTSNRELTINGLESNLESFPALARRIDLMVEVRRNKDVQPDPNRIGFDPTGVYFYCTRYNVDKTREGGGSWEPISYPLCWREFCIATALMFRHKRRTQQELDYMPPVSEDMKADLELMTAKYTNYRGKSVDAFIQYALRELEPGNSTYWRLYQDNPNAPNKPICVDRVPVMVPKYPVPGPSRPIFEPDIIPTDVGATHPQNGPRNAEEFKRAVEEAIAGSDCGDGQSTRSGIVSDDEEFHAQAEEEDEWYDCEEFYVTQAQDIPACPVSGCQFTRDPFHWIPEHIDLTQYGIPNPIETREISLLHFWQHLIIQAAQEQEQHKHLPKNWIKQFEASYNGGNDRLTEEEMRWYELVQDRYIDYAPPNFNITLSEAYLTNRMALVRVILAYYRDQEYKPWWMRILSYPQEMIKILCCNLQNLTNGFISRISLPISQVSLAIRNAEIYINEVRHNLKKYSIVGLILIAIAGILGYIYTLIHKAHSDNKVPIITPAPAPQEQIVKLLVEGSRESGSENVATKKKKQRQYQIETDVTYDTEAGVSMSASEKVASKQKKKVYTVESNTCRYAATNYYLSTDPSLLLERVAQDESPELKIQRFGKQLRFQWSDQEEPIMKEINDVFEINDVVTTVVKEHMPRAEGESQLSLVRDMIGNLPPMAEASCDNDAMNALWKTSHNLALVRCANVGTRVRGLFLQSHVLMVPAHLTRDLDLEKVVLEISTSESTFEYPLSKGAYYVDSEKDTLIIDVNYPIPAKPSIIKSFISETDEFRDGEKGYLIVAHKAINQTKMVAMWQNVTNIEYQSEMSYVDHSEGKVIVVLRGVTYDCESSDGWCGAPLLRFSPTCPRKLIGIHVAGRKCGGFASIWTQERIKDALARLGQTQAESLKDESYPEVMEKFFPIKCNEESIELPTVTPLYAPEKKFVPAQPLTTKLKRSRLFDKIVEHRSAPSKKLPFINSQGIVRDPMRQALDKLDSPMVILDEDLLTMSALRMEVIYKERNWLKPVTSYGKLPLNINIGGDPECEWVKKINMKTSPGYPYILAGGKHLYLDQDTQTVTPLLQAAIDQRELNAKQGLHTPMLLVDVMKDERLSLDKIEKGKIRLFNVCPLDFNILIRKYFGSFMASMMAMHLMNEVSVGINPHDESWKLFYNRLKARGSHWIAGDYSAWDKRLPVQVAYALLPMVEHFYQQFDDYKDEDATVRRILFEQTFQSIRLARKEGDAVIYAVHQSMPSGVAITAVFNSLINALLFRYIYAELAISHGWSKTRAINNYDAHVSFAAYGDDHIARVSEVAFEFFNMTSIASQMEKHHIEYTSPSKQVVIEREISDENLTYLKRHFVWRKECGRLDAPMEIEQVLDILNWVHVETGVDEKEAANCAIMSVLIELTHFDRETFKHWYSKILEQGFRAGLRVPIVDYQDMVDARQHVQNFDLDFY